MNKIYAIKYIDALYFKKNEKFNFIDFPVHTAIGQIKATSEYVALVFSEENFIPRRGIILPKEALILEEESDKAKLEEFNSRFKIKKNSAIGIYWKDIVYFDGNKIPDKLTIMYSEGKVFSLTSNAIIIKNPETITVNKKIKNHPVEQASFIVIPKLFIIDIELYDKKL